MSFSISSIFWTKVLSIASLNVMKGIFIEARYVLLYIRVNFWLKAGDNAKILTKSLKKESSQNKILLTKKNSAISTDT